MLLRVSMGKVLLLIVRRGGMPETGRRTVRLRWCCVLSCRSVLLLPLLLLLEPPLGRAPKRRLCRRGLGVSWSGIAKLRLHVKIILISCGHGEGSSCAGSSCAGKNDEKVLTRRCHVRPRLNDCWNTAQLTENC